MADSPVPVPDTASRFFSNRLSCLDKASVPEKQRRWYVKGVEGFINAQNGRRIKHLTAGDLNRDFEMLIAERQLVNKCNECF